MYLAYLLTLYQILQIGTLQDINLSRSKLFKQAFYWTISYALNLSSLL